MNALAQSWPDGSGSPDHALLLAAVQVLPESVAIASSGLIIYANPWWCGMFECPSPTQVQGLPVEGLLPVDLLSLGAGTARDADCEGDRGARFVHVRQDGTRQHLELTRESFHLRDKEFQIIHARDISRQIQVERQLREAQEFEALGRLVGGVAHDFNNMLTGIMLYCDLLIGELERESRPHRHVQEMRMAGEHGAALVQQLLAVARPRSGEPRVFALNDVVTGMEDLMTRLMGENIVLNTSLAADLGAVRMEPSQVQQILLNLVLNARDAMPRGGQLTLSTRNCIDHDLEHDSSLPGVTWVELSVSDTGDGMDSETLNRAFEPFFTTKAPGRGNGLGLATARRLARQEGGTIVAESQPGKGTRVSVRLPQVQPDSLAGSQDPSDSKVEVIS